MAFSALLNASLIAFFLAVSTKTSLVLVGACSDWSALQNTKTGLAQQRNALLESSFLNDNFERLFTNSTSSYLPENETKLAQNKLAILEKIISLVSLSEKLSEIGNRRNKTITMKILLDAIIQDSCQYVKETYNVDSLTCSKGTSEVKHTLLRLKLYTETIRAYVTVRVRAPEYDTRDNKNDSIPAFCHKHLARNCYVQTHVQSYTTNQQEFIDRILIRSGPGLQRCYPATQKN